MFGMNTITNVDPIDWEEPGTIESRRSNCGNVSTNKSSRKREISSSDSPGRSNRHRRSWISFACILTATLGLLSTIGVHAQMQSSDPRNLVCVLDHFRTAVYENTLFLDGGEWTTKDMFRSNGTAIEPNMWQNEYLWRLDLSKSFNVSQPPWTLEAKPASHDEHYNGAEETLWDIGDGTFTTVGGWFSPYHGPPGQLYGPPLFTSSATWQAPTPRIFKYDMRTRTWTNKLLPKTITRISTASTTSSKRLRRGWALGGVLTIEQANSLPRRMYSLDKYLDTFTEYNFINDTWETTTLPEGIGGTVDGELINLERVGDGGVLLFLGGERKFKNGTTLTQVYERRSLETVWIYDIAKKGWYGQLTVGEIPPGRRGGCSVMVPAPDLSSYQIYLFSGSLYADKNILDLYVLTVPGFIWTKIDLAAAGYPDTLGMRLHKCALTEGGRQMIIVPGVRNASLTDEDPFQQACNPGTSIRVFDTQEWVFKETFVPDLKGPKVPQGVIDLIGGNGDGGAKMKSPKAGWASGSEKNLETLFAKINDPIIYNDDVNGNSNLNSTSTTSLPPSATNANLASGEESKSMSTGTIAGIVAGSVVGLSLLGLLIFLLSRRRKNIVNGGDTAELQGEAASTKEHYNLASELSSTRAYSPRHELDGGYEPHVLMERHKSAYQPEAGVEKDHQEVVP